MINVANTIHALNFEVCILLSSLVQCIYFMTLHIMHIIIENLSSMIEYLSIQSQKMLEFTRTS